MSEAPQQPQQPGYTQQGYPQYVTEPPATSKATLALVLGIVGLTICPGAASIPAWIIGTALAALGLLAIGAIFLIGAVFVSSVDDCHATGNDSDFTVQC